MVFSVSRFGSPLCDVINNLDNGNGKALVWPIVVVVAPPPDTGTSGERTTARETRGGGAGRDGGGHLSRGRYRRLLI